MVILISYLLFSPYLSKKNKFKKFFGEKYFPRFFPELRRSRKRLEKNSSKSSSNVKQQQVFFFREFFPYEIRNIFEDTYDILMTFYLNFIGLNYHKAFSDV